MADQKNPTILNRIARGIGIFSFLMLIASGVLAFLYRQMFVEFLESGYGYVAIIFAINALVSVVLALLIIARNPDQVIGWLFLTVGFLFSWNEISSFLLGLFNPMDIPGFIRPLVLLGGLAYLLPLMITIALIPLFFPDGRLLSRRWRPVLFIVLVGIIGQTLAQGFLDVLTEIPSLGDTGTETFILWLGGITEIILILGIVGSLASLVVRFIRSRGDERTQMKWLVYTAVMSISASLLMSALLGEDSLILGIFSSGIPTYLTIAIGLAILRYRLYDIDIVIRRTLQYAILTFMLGSVYFSGVVLLQNIFGALAGQSDSPLITVISTLTIAALFNPLRIRIQDFIDQRFFRKKYDAERALEGFAAAARSETDLDTLTAQVVDIVNNAMQPERVGLWLQQDKPWFEDRMPDYE